MLASILAQGGSEPYMPHGMCYLWQQDLVWVHVVSDALTTLAYWAIPPFLIYLAVRARNQIPDSAAYARRRLPYDWMFVAFGVFIVACGATHAMGIWTIWEPRYWLEGGVKAVTALASVATAIALPPLVPRVLELVREARESELRRVELEEAHREQRDLVERLRRAHRARSRFFANVSHDLRTPLSLVLGPVREVLEEADLREDLRDRLETVLRNARTLSGQVEDLLTVSEAETGELEVDPRPVDLAALVQDAAGHFSAHARGRSMDFRVETPEARVVRADPELWKRAILNLLSNAFEFTPDGGTVRCEVGTEGEDAVLEVSDSGPGVPEEERDRVFRRFEQAGDGDGDDAEGAGLGLAIVREVVRAHGGSVELDRGPEGGARFTLRFPLRGGAGELPARDGALPGAAAGGGADDPGGGLPGPERESTAGGTVGAGPDRIPRPTAGRSADGEGEEDEESPIVLVVEDDDDMRDYLARILSEGRSVAVAADGREGLERARELRPDLIVTDVMMPGMDGEELLAVLREHPGLEEVPVLVLTARADRELPERMLRGGAQDYVRKPVRAAELRARVDNLLELTRSRRLMREELSATGESLEELVRSAADRKRRLERTVRQKEVLMRELHHRVKGNLQTVTSLLQLQLRDVEDERVRRPLEESRGRVAAMGLVHEQLYGEGVPDRVELAGYLRRLVADVLQSRGPSSPVSTTLELEELEAGTDDAVACGLIVHELVTNALEHAFPEDGGELSVSLRRRDGRAVLAVADDGRGLGGDAAGPDGAVGLELVRSLVGQLDGRLRIRERDGTRVEIVFRVAAASERGEPGIDHPDGGGQP